MRFDSMMLPSIQFGLSTPHVQAQGAPCLSLQGGDWGNPYRSQALVPVVRSAQSRTDTPSSQEHHAAHKTVEAALQALAQVDGAWADVSGHGSAVHDGGQDPLRTAGQVLDLSAQKEIERMLVEARGHAASIERSRRHLQCTLNMVVDLIHLEAARLGPGGHVSPD